MADNVKIIFTGDGSGFFRETQKIKSEVGNLKNELVGGFKGALFAYFSIEALKEEIAKFDELIERLAVVKRQTGATSDEAQVWEKQMKRVGGTLEDVSRMMGKLAAARDKALANPGGKEDKAFSSLGLNRETLINAAEPAEIFKKLQEQISKTGTAAGAFGNLMDLLGEKSVKFLSVFASSFNETEDALRRSGRLIDSQLIAKYEEMLKLSKEHPLSEAILGGPSKKAQLFDDIQEAFVKFKGGLSFTLSSMWNVGNKDKQQALWEEMVKHQTEIVQAGGQSKLDGGGLPEGFITPSEYKEIEGNTKKLGAERFLQMSRIEEQRSENADKELNDQEKLAKLYREQDGLLHSMMALESNGTKRSSFLDEMEQYLRMIPKVNEQKAKVDKAQEQEAKKWQSIQKNQDHLLTEFMDKAEKAFTPHVMSDSLVAVGNFLGSSKSRLESLTMRTNELLQEIRDEMKEYIDSGQVNSSDDFPRI